MSFVKETDGEISELVAGDVCWGKSDQVPMPGFPWLTGSHVDGRAGDQMLKVVKVNGGKSAQVNKHELSDKHFGDMQLSRW